MNAKRLRMAEERMVNERLLVMEILEGVDDLILRIENNKIKLTVRGYIW
jgi:hypothetical protein